MTNLEWTYNGTGRWRAPSIEGYIWHIKSTGESGMFTLIDNNRLPWNAAPFATLQSAKAWCEAREAEMVAAQPVKRLVKLYRNRVNGHYSPYLTESACRSDHWEYIGSAWITEGEFADD